MSIIFKTNSGEVLKGKMIDWFIRCLSYDEKVYKVNVKGEVLFVEFWKVIEVTK